MKKLPNGTPTTPFNSKLETETMDVLCRISLALDVSLPLVIGAVVEEYLVKHPQYRKSPVHKMATAGSK